MGQHWDKSAFQERRTKTRQRSSRYKPAVTKHTHTICLEAREKDVRRQDEEVNLAQDAVAPEDMSTKHTCPGYDVGLLGLLQAAIEPPSLDHTTRQENVTPNSSAHLCPVEASGPRAGTRKRKLGSDRVPDGVMPYTLSALKKEHQHMVLTRPTAKKWTSLDVTMMVDKSTATIVSGNASLRLLETSLGLGDMKVGRRILSLHVARQLAGTRFQRGLERAYNCALHSLDGTPRHLHCTMRGEAQVIIWSIRDDTSPTSSLESNLQEDAYGFEATLARTLKAQESSHDYGSIELDLMHNTAVADASSLKGSRSQKPYRFCAKCWLLTGDWVLRSITLPTNDSSVSLNGHKNGICPRWPSRQVPSAVQDRSYATAFKAAQKKHTLCCIAVDNFKMHLSGMPLEHILRHVRCEKIHQHND